MAILTQINDQKDHSILTYASCKLQKHEKNCTPLLLEIQATIWGMGYFFTHLFTWLALPPVQQQQVPGKAQEGTHQNDQLTARSHAKLQLRDHLQKGVQDASQLPVPHHQCHLLEAQSASTKAGL